MPKTDSSFSCKFIFVTGGVMSGLGKGVTAASVGRLLINAGFKVTAVKIDPYINVDAGTMNPYQHGEVYVLKDGSEVDLDLGNYERFLGIDMTGSNNITTGKVYQHVIQKERTGDYLGKTVQIIPHITDDIKKKIRKVALGNDVCIVEVGGTVGDIESMPFLESLRQLSHEEDKNSVLFIHVTLVPRSKNGELKTKPTQHSVKELRSIGIQPDIIVGRSNVSLDDTVREKIALFCDVPSNAVFSNPDLDDIYQLPMLLETESLDEYVMEKLNLTKLSLKPNKRDTHWRDLVTKPKNKQINIALIGKYGLEDAYISVHEALKHAGIFHGTKVNTSWIHSETLDGGDISQLSLVDGIIIPGGFGSRGTQGKINAIQHARESNLPYLGLCLGFQLAVVEYSRNVLGLKDAHSSEIQPDTPNPVIDLLPEQHDINELGGSMRLGELETQIERNSLAHSLYGSIVCNERHRHRYEVNPDYADLLERSGLKFTGKSGHRMEILELPGHSYFFGTQFHPEFTSRPTTPSPPFMGLVDAALNQNSSLTNGRK
jgi:CTP synthase